eukprot:TRINITY_DN26272_c0_g1_i4.p1 TRINITY_DN26272_c0_g1~~TRINITY_DN26272_c0_g1_i4.p1  ORF type:complete len:300 (-),score=41.24 TRINITY_DN26272_c0_g1_i4:147-1046(-)
MQRAIFASIQSANSYTPARSNYTASRPAPAPRPSASFSRSTGPTITRDPVRRTQARGGASVGTGGHGRLAREGIMPVTPSRRSLPSPPCTDPDRAFANQGFLRVPKSYLSSPGNRSARVSMPAGWAEVWGSGSVSERQGSSSAELEVVPGTDKEYVLEWEPAHGMAADTDLECSCSVKVLPGGAGMRAGLALGICNSDPDPRWVQCVLDCDQRLWSVETVAMDNGASSVTQEHPQVPDRSLKPNVWVPINLLVSKNTVTLRSRDRQLLSCSIGGFGSPELAKAGAVSYTHLTLPTKRIV